MNILVLHNIENVANARTSALDHVLCFERYAPDHVYFYYRTSDPVTPALAGAPWHLILFTSTALGVRTYRPRSLLEALKDDWAFLRQSPALKFIFPQDEPFHAGTIDDWFSELPNTTVFSIFPEHKRLFYPRLAAKAEFHATLTGYIDDDTIPFYQRYSRPFEARSRLIGQRATFYPERGGGFARLKGASAVAMRDEAVRRGIRHDISVDDADAIYGASWYRFMGDCRFFLGSEGGLGLCDRYGRIADRIAEYKSETPGATFEEIRRNCWGPEDERLSFRALSPRTLEAALMGSCQVNVVGRYHGLIAPHEHYIPLNEDLSNFDEVFEAMRDEAGAQRRIAACKAALVDNPAIRFSTLTRKVLDVAARLAPSAALERQLSQQALAALRDRHGQQLITIAAERVEREGFTDLGIARRVGFLQKGQVADTLMSPEPIAALAMRLRRVEIEHDLALREMERMISRVRTGEAETASLNSLVTAVESRVTTLERIMERLAAPVRVLSRPGRVMRERLKVLLGRPPH